MAERNAGRGEETKAERAAALKTLNDTQYELWKIKQASQPYEINIANGFWSDKSVPPSPQYLTALQNFYGAQCSAVDFQNSAEQQRQNINHWISQQTNGRIKDLFGEGSIKSDTYAVLANAIYFKGTWQTLFSESATRPGDFHLADGSKKSTSLMHLDKKRFRYAELKPDGTTNTPVVKDRFQRTWPANPDGFKLIELPYKGDGISMLVILPNKPDGLPALEKQINHDKIKSWMKQMAFDDVNLTLPKFNMESSCDLTKILSQLGIKKAFQPGGLTGFSDAPESQRFFLGAALHRGFIMVNERGTEAAAATGVIVEKSIKPTPATFKADHPFLFLIRDQKTESILFMGRLMTPSN